MLEQSFSNNSKKTWGVGIRFTLKISYCADGLEVVTDYVRYDVQRVNDAYAIISQFLRCYHSQEYLYTNKGTHISTPSHYCKAFKRCSSHTYYEQ